MTHPVEVIAQWLCQEDDPERPGPYWVDGFLVAEGETELGLQREAARRLVAALKREGLAIVPIEATEEMLAATMGRSQSTS